MGRRDQDVHFLASKEEVQRIHEKMDELGIRSMGAYLRKMALDGYCINLDLQDVKELVSLLRRCSNNLNQYAKRANETGNIKFFEEHREEIQIHKAAKKAFDQLPGKKVPTRQSLNEEYHRLLSGKKEAYAEYRQVKKDMQEYLIAKQTVEHILGIDRKNRIITQQQNLD